MKVVIPLAGYGKRMRPHTYSKPKPLLNVAGKPVLAHVIDQFAGLSVDQFVFIVGHLGDQIQEWVESHYSCDARFVEQSELLGQAHALYLARDLLQGPIMTVFVDTLFRADLSIATQSLVDGIAYCLEIDDPRRFGVAVVDGEGYVTRLIEKPETLEHKRVVVGLYYIKEGQRLVSAIKTLMDRGAMFRGEYYLTNALQVMIDDGAKFRTATVDVWKDCGKPDALLETNRYLLSHGQANAQAPQYDDAVVIPPSYVSPTATLHRCVIGPYATICDGCQISDAVIRNAIIDEGAIMSNVVIEGSLIGAHATLHGTPQTLNLGDSSTLGLSLETDETKRARTGTQH